MAVYSFYYDAVAQTGNDVFNINGPERMLKKVWMSSLLLSGATNNYIYNLEAVVAMYLVSTMQGVIADVPAGALGAAGGANNNLNFSSKFVWSGEIWLRGAELNFDYYLTYPSLITPDPGDSLRLYLNMIIE